MPHGHGADLHLLWSGLAHAHTAAWELLPQTRRLALFWQWTVGCLAAMGPHNSSALQQSGKLKAMHGSTQELGKVLVSDLGLGPLESQEIHPLTH